MSGDGPIDKSVLLTGAAGGIGVVLREAFRPRYRLVRLLDRAPLGDLAPSEEAAQVDITDLDALAAATQGIDTVVHLAGVPVEDDWEPIHAANIVGCYNMFEAARRCGVKRFVFASSNHVIGFYPRDRDVDEVMPPRPDGRYGVSKVFGEAVGRLYHDKHGMEVVCLRIGSFRPAPVDVRMLATWISHGDMARLACAAVDAPDVTFAVVYGVSRNPRSRWTDSWGEAIGYVPQDSAEDHAEAVLARMRPEDEPPVERHFHGGTYCGMEYSGPTDWLE